MPSKDEKLASKYELLPPEAWHYYKTHPIEFIRAMILTPHSKSRGENLFLSDQQIEVIEAMATDRHITVRSGKGIGKSALISFICIWFASCFDEAKIVLTAPSAATLRSGLFREVKKWVIGSFVEGMFEVTSERVYVDTEIIEGSVPSQIEMRTAVKGNPESMAGLHEKNMLLCADEASNVPDEILHNLVSTLTSGDNNKMLMCSNPTRNTGIFRDSHLDDPIDKWTKFKFSSEDSPFTSKQNILESEMKYGRDSNSFKIDVTGDFPDSDPDTFLDISEVYAAFDREVTPRATDEIEIGVDVARFGDDNTCLFWRHGMKVHPPIFKGRTSGDEVVSMVYELVSQIRATTGYKESIRVKVDSTGLGGTVCDFLKLDRKHDIDVIECNFGERASSERYANLVSEMWGTLKDVIGMVSLPGEGECDNRLTVKALREELSARRVDYGTGKVKIEPKAVFKKEFGRSPDFADALVLCFARKKSQRTFLSDFDHLSKNYVINNMTYLNGLDHYISLHYTTDRQVSAVWAYWGNGTLYITNEMITDDNVARVASQINNGSNVAPKKILGNARCFGNPSQDIKAQLRRFKVRLRDNYRYDELGALELLNQLVHTKSIKLLNKCNSTISQLDKWNSDVKKAEAERDYGLCYAILNIVSELKDKINPKRTPMERRSPYSSSTQQQQQQLYNKALTW